MGLMLVLIISNGAIYKQGMLGIDWESMAKSVKIQKRRLGLIEKYADVILLSPAESQFFFA